MDSPKKPPLLTPLLRWFMFTMVLANTAGHMLFLLMPIYLIELGATITEVGLVFTLSSVVPVAFQILGGWISDSIGRLRAVALGSLAGVIGHIILIFAPSWQWVLISFSIGSIARAFVGPSFGAFIAEQSSEENRGQVYGISEMIFMIVAVIGPPLGGFLAGQYNFKLMLTVAAVLYTLAAVLRFWMAGRVSQTTDSKTEPPTLQSLRSNLGKMVAMLTAGGLLTWLLITDGVRDIAFQLSNDLMPLYLEQIGGMEIVQIGWLGSLFGISIMAVTIPSGWLADRRGERVPIALGFFLQFIAFIALLQAQTFVQFALVWMIFGSGVGMMSPAYNSLVSKAFPEKMRGIAFGVFQTSLGIISLPAPYIGAQLWMRFSARLPFFVTALAMLAAILPVWLKFKLPGKTDKPSEPHLEGPLE